MEQRSAAISSVRSICHNLINTLTGIWASLPQPLEDEAIDSMEVATSAAKSLEAVEARFRMTDEGKLFLNFKDLDVVGIERKSSI